MTLLEYRQHLINTMRECDIHDTAISVAMNYVPVPELSKQAAQVCWLLGYVADEHTCMRAVRDYLNVLNREGEYVFDDEPEREFREDKPITSTWREVPVSKAGCACASDGECDCGLCDDEPPKSQHQYRVTGCDCEFCDE